MQNCVITRVLPDVKDHSAFILRLKQSQPHNMASHPRRFDSLVTPLW